MKQRTTYKTHTELPSALSALQTFSVGQRIFIGISLVTILIALWLTPFKTLQFGVAFISILYFIDTVFNLVLILLSLNKPKELRFTKEELQSVADEDLPVYSILCPLYKEAHVLPQFVQAIEALDWPKDKLDVLLLLEEDDVDSIATIDQMQLPGYIRKIIVPHSLPKTKPKACNYGLLHARGEYLVIYDAEDIPDTAQLKKAYLGFAHSPKHVVCLQAKLNYYNARQNFLTRFFAAEYSLWFDLTLTGIQSIKSAIPLGGTSNHFKTKVLRELQGWDPFNVTEDADLGVRLFKKGYQTAIIESTTLEEATSKVKNWIRQRSRWIKGYMQTYLVHTRNPAAYIKEKGLWHHLIFQLTVGGKLLFILLNPLMWVITLAYFFAYPLVGPAIQAIYQPPISYLAVFSWIFGNFLFFYYYMIGCARRNQWDLMKYIFLIPFYWVLLSIAGCMALYQLILKPHYWEKTVHGFHLQQNGIPVPAATTSTSPVSIQQPVAAPVLSPAKRLAAFQLRVRLWQTLASVVSGVPFLLFLTGDVTIAMLLLPFNLASSYLLLAFAGKFLFIAAQLLASLVARSHVYMLIFFTFLFQWIGFIIFGYEGYGGIPYLDFYLFGCLCFVIADVIGVYYFKRGSYAMTFSSILLLIIQLIALSLSHNTISDIVLLNTYFTTLILGATIFFVIDSYHRQILDNNIKSFLGAIMPSSPEKAWRKKELRILVFNWRDTKHVYAGGAEVYIHELAKRWVKDGNKVTLFCGNDNKSVAHQTVDGIEIVRNGGTYTVYLFAILYYLLKFRGKYDVIVDCENGIPFFAPLWTRRPVILVIHHIHQEVFRAFLRFPFNHLAQFLEGKVMPLVYKNKQIITVSESSKKEIVKLGFTKEENITVVHNGIVGHTEQIFAKTDYPSFMYLGRLKAYKNVAVAIEAFAHVAKAHPTAKFSIVGTGECENELRALVTSLHLENHVDFLGKVNEEEKYRLYTEAWAMIQPSQIEGWGITVIESNSVGTPVIASRVKGLQDSVVDGKTGILVEFKNVKAFSQAMELIITDESYRKELSHNASVWAQNFSWDKSAHDFYMLIGKSIHKKELLADYTAVAPSLINL